MTKKPVLAAMLLAIAGAAVVPATLMAQDRDDMGMMRGGPAFDFAEVDADKDGKVTKEELEAWRAGRVAALDSDSDGFVSADELKASMMARAEGRIDAMVEARLAARDSDGDGKLSAAEMMARPVPTRLFDRVDADGDGAVSEDEIAQMHEKMTDRRERGKGHGKGEHRMHRGHHFWGDMDE